MTDQRTNPEKSTQELNKAPKTCGDTKWGRFGDLRCRLEPDHPGRRHHEGFDSEGKLVRW